MAKDKFEELATQYFGGAGTKEQAVRVCAYTVTTLRKIVTAMRRDLNKLSPSEYLRIHAVVALENNIVTLKKGKPMNERLDLFLGYLARSAHPHHRRALRSQPSGVCERGLTLSASLARRCLLLVSGDDPVSPT